MLKPRYNSILIILFALANQFSLHAQTKKIDSLRIALTNCKDDTSKIKTLNTLGIQLNEINSDTAIILSNQALQMCNKLMASPEKGLRLQVKSGMITALSNLGLSFSFKSDYSRALDYNFKALKMAEEIGNKNKIATVIGNIGTIYFRQGNFPNALEYYLKDLKIREELGDKKKIGGPLGNTGIIYLKQGEFAKAMSFFFRALKAEEACGNKKGILRNLGNLGNANSNWAHILRNKGDTAKANILSSKALEYFFSALKIGQELGNMPLISTTLMNMANIYADRANATFASGNKAYANSYLYPKAFNTYFSALKIAEDLGGKSKATIILSHLGSLYTETGKYKEAYEYLYKALAISTEIGELYEQKFDYDYLSTLYEKSTIPLQDSIGGKMLNKEEMRLRALYYYKKYMNLKDTIFNQENKDQILQKEMNYDFEKKVSATKADQDKKDAIAVEELKQKELQRNYFIIGFALLAILALFIFRGLIQKKKANKIISEQKILVEEKQKEILDSIHYAKRIQTSLLPTEKYIERILNRN